MVVMVVEQDLEDREVQEVQEEELLLSLWVTIH
jgi:hypothetical protein